MKFKLCIILLNFTLISLFAQDVKSAGDRFFFQYNYKQAAREYEKEKAESRLTDLQYLKLAESYFNTDNFKKASEVYKMMYEGDTEISPYHFNKMLRSLSKNEGYSVMNDFLKKDTILKKSTWIETAKFNFDTTNKKEKSITNYNIFNLKENSSQADFSPTFYKDKLLFTSGREWAVNKKRAKKKSTPYLNIVAGRIDATGEVGNVTNFSGIPKGNFHEATPYYSAELDEIFYVLSNEEDGEMIFDSFGKNALAIGKVNGNNKFELILKDLSTSFYYPYYDATSQRLYFAANFSDSYGGTDIYYVNTNQGRIMSAPINLGPEVNTPGNEISPYIFDGGLYFSSDVFYGYGGMDIYKSNLKQDLSAGIPINLGKGINSIADEFGFIVRDDKKGGLEGYFSSNRQGGKGLDDIFSFKVTEKPKLNTIVLSGRTVNSKTGVRVGNVAIKLIGQDNKVIKKIVSADDGTYSVEVPWRDKVDVIASKVKYSSQRVTLNVDALGNAKNNRLDFSLDFVEDIITDKEGKKVLKLNNLVFKMKRAELTPGITAELDKAVKIIKNFPAFNLQIESHTDSKGGSSSNFKVSQNRADAIKKYLLDNGVPSRNILYTIGYGEDNIRNKCTNRVYCIDYLHAKNRRSLIVVLNYRELY